MARIYAQKEVHPSQLHRVDKAQRDAEIREFFIQYCLPTMKRGEDYSLKEMLRLFSTTLWAEQGINSKTKKKAGLFRHMLLNDGLSTVIDHERTTASYLKVTGWNEETFRKMEKAIEGIEKTARETGCTVKTPATAGYYVFFSPLIGKGWMKWSEAGALFRCYYQPKALRIAESLGFEIETYRGESGFSVK